MEEVNVIPTYKVKIKRYPIGEDGATVILVNINNDFDVIEIKVSKEVDDVVDYSSYYSIATTIKRTWYTLWLGIKKEYHVLGNINDKGKVMITTETINNLKKGYKRSYYNESNDI